MEHPEDEARPRNMRGISVWNRFNSFADPFGIGAHVGGSAQVRAPRKALTMTPGPA
jgi:hypothetical protein